MNFEFVGSEFDTHVTELSKKYLKEDQVSIWYLVGSRYVYIKYVKFECFVILV